MGTLVVSLDFELFWGVRDVTTLERYGANIRGVRQAIPRMLDLFRRYGVHATWATVGFLFFSNKRELMAALPTALPTYADRSLSPYDVLDRVGEDERSDPYHFGRDLLDQIRATEAQEIATHTFSHYYTLERGPTIDAFEADLVAARRVGATLGLDLRSLVFPRNQYSPASLEVCRKVGILAYRGNERSWIYRGRAGAHTPSWRRAARLMDSIVDLSGHHTYALEAVERRGLPFDLPASRFLRPHSSLPARFEKSQLRRITTSMTYAADRDHVFHLWWHPHNFGVNVDANLERLERVLDHFAFLRDTRRMESASMGELADRLVRKRTSELHA